MNIFQRRRQLMEERLGQDFQSRTERMRNWTNRPLMKADSAGRWRLSFNPPGLVELQMAVGVGVGYQITNCWQVWLESSALMQFYQKPSQSCIGGVREILASKWYFGPRGSLFAAAEFRWKQVYYRDVGNFVFGEPTTPQTAPKTLSNYTYQLENIVFGGAVWFGGRIRLSNDHRWQMEPSIGLGFKGRTVYRYGVPAGFVPKNGYFEDTGLWPWSPRNGDRFLPYTPASVRIFYVL